ncbi:O-methyltransferase [Solihabitans fulvus]|uniref:O-methyltransferase n=1 Tax=Solihabitans fulvus TaxID=1892852 RepID=A0A5B2WTD2_9PSEU|nr:O-methyltransferase [Solihabitans fulvus]
MAPAIEAVLARLEERSAREQPELERLNGVGAAATRAAAPGLMLDVGPQVGRLLNALVRITDAKFVLEVGGSVGYSTVWLAEALTHTGGHALSLEPEPDKAVQLGNNLAAAGLGDHVDVLVEDAGAVIPRLAGPFDVVLIDHWKDLYVREFDAAWPKLREGGVIVADNICRPTATADLMQEYVEHVRNAPGAYSFTLDIGNGVELTWRTNTEEA